MYVNNIPVSPWLHRFAALEEFEDAERCYRKALGIDTRHYNAWYGLGMTYLRQEKFEFAQHQFQLALQINPRSSVIMCYYGIALHESKVSEIRSSHQQSVKFRISIPLFLNQTSTH